MNPVGVEMLFFLPAVFVVHWLLPRRAAVQNSVLLLASCVFYAAFSKLWLLWLLAGATLDFAVGRQLAAVPRPDDTDHSPAAHAARRTRRRWLLTALVADLGMLAWCKYAGPAAAAVGGLLTGLGLPTSLPVLHLMLPLGLSFHTLQRVGYLLDVYWGRLPAETSLLRLLCFATFFPQITAGPIGRASALLPQYAEPRRLTAQALADAGLWFLGGYLLKAFAAWRLAEVVDPVFAAPAQYGMVSHYVAVGGFGLQVFCDFAGYSLMAIAVGAAFGLRLPENFRLPFSSRNLPEVWRRWHISFNQWLFDYVFVPATTGSSWLRGRTATCLMVTFLVSGLWHGSTLPFLLWGALHGLGMVVHFRFDQAMKHKCRADRRWVERRRSPAWSALAWLITQAFFFATLVPFRCADAAATWEFAEGMAGVGTGPQNALAVRGALPRMTLLLAVALPIGWHLLELLQRLRLRERFFALPAPLRGVAYGFVIVFLLVFVPVGAGTFVYRNF